MNSKPGFRFILFILAAFLTLAGCEEELKPTVIKGIVLDRSTGAAINGAIVIIGYKNYADQYVSETGVSTDSSGRFEYTKFADQVKIGTIAKSGYLPNYGPFEIKKHEENDGEYTLLPLNADLECTFRNTSGTYDTLFYNLEVPSILFEFPWFGSIFGAQDGVYHQPIDSQEQFVLTNKFPAGEPVVLHWGFEGYAGFVSPFSDTLYLTVTDTTHYLLAY